MFGRIETVIDRAGCQREVPTKKVDRSTNTTSMRPTTSRHEAHDGVGSDADSPDAADVEDFAATFTALDNHGVALVAIANLDTRDIIIPTTVSLPDGSGFSVDPIACHGRVRHR